jgi:Cdc6-like AAA superfamily ATPase
MSDQKDEQPRHESQTLDELWPTPGQNPPTPIAEDSEDSNVRKPPSLSLTGPALRQIRPDSKLIDRPEIVDEIIALLHAAEDSTVLVTAAEGSGRSTLANLVANRIQDPDYKGPLAGQPVVLIEGSLPDFITNELINELAISAPQTGAIVVFDDVEALLGFGISRENRSGGPPEELSLWRLLHSDPLVPVIALLSQDFVSEFEGYDTLFAAEMRQVHVDELPPADLRKIARAKAQWLARESGLSVEEAVIDAILEPALDAETRSHPGLAIDRLQVAAGRASVAKRDEITVADLTQKIGGLARTTPVTLDDALAKLDSLIGLDTVKQAVRGVAHAQQANVVRKEQGLPTLPLGLNLAFTGSPGTGKTTVARIVGEVYKSLGILPRGNFVEVTRPDLVAGFVGWTAPRVRAVARKAFGGVLFIDEAYSLSQGHHWDFGSEAITELLRVLEEHRDRLAVIVAGYSDEMRQFFEANPGLRSRFQQEIEFPDYSDSELVQIWEHMANEYRLDYTKETLIAVRRHLQTRSTGGDSGNARLVRTLVTQMFKNMASRAGEDAQMESSEIRVLQPEDVPPSLSAEQAPGAYL